MSLPNMRGRDGKDVIDRLVHQFAAAGIDFLMGKRAIQGTVFLLAAAGIDFLTCERADQTGFRRYVP